MDSFHAALDAGADAVYLGVGNFNARLRAENFTPATLAYLVPYAHKHNVKIYITLNTLLKQDELLPALDLLHQLDQIGPDALIVTDFGLIGLAQRHFPKLRLHGSTQMAVHNSAGARELKRMGIDRVILSRELTLEEIAAIKRAADIELEIFVHGALCYCISGLCLASSFLGGSSGNRGRCTQVCRRPFRARGTEARYYSPRDLSAVSLLPRIRELGISSLKIEGRMKNAAYVYRVVDAFRRTLDGKLEAGEAEQLLEGDYGRPKTTLFMDSMRNPGIIDTRMQSGTGIVAGRIERVDADGIVLDRECNLAPGDRLRIQPSSGFEGAPVQVLSAAPANSRTIIRLKTTVECGPGDEVYLTGHAGDTERFDRRGIPGVEPVPFSRRYPPARKILEGYSAAPVPGKQRELLWVKVDTVEWLDHLANSRCQRLVFAGDAASMDRLLADGERLRIWRSRLVVGLPPFIPEGDIRGWKTLADRFIAAGVKRAACSNPGHRLVYSKEFEFGADAPLWCMNRASQQALQEAGYSSFVYSWEDDYLNIKAAASDRGTVCLFGHVPLFISRIIPAIAAGETLTDSFGNAFRTAQANGLHYLLSEKPLCLTHRRKKLLELGIRNFLIDLSFRPVDPDWLQTLLRCYDEGTRLPGTSVFNFKAGLK